MQDNHKHLKYAIRVIADQIVSDKRNNGLAGFSFDHHLKVVAEQNKNNIFNDVTFNEIIAAFHDILKNDISDVEFHDYHFIEPLVIKSILLHIEDNDDPEPPPTEARKIPLMTVDALEYKYNNDKNTFKNIS